VIRRILCPIDFSEFSDRALGYAVALARAGEAEITALHVFAWMAPSEDLPDYVQVPVLRPEGRQHLLEDLIRFTDRVNVAGVSVNAVLREGRPVTEILQKAKGWPADLIVMGTHGRSGYERMILGSLTEKVLRKSPCPVLTVTRSANAPRGDAAPFARILCPIDFSQPSLRALEQAFSFVDQPVSSLVVLHVLDALPDEGIPQNVHFSVPEYRRYLRRDAEQRLRAAVPDEVRKRCVVEEVVALGAAHRAIVRIAQEREVDLIAMGIHGRGAVDLALFGSTTNHVVREAHCPVLTLRDSE
jgi:nucleotide-binding universal stress UspA family protein